MAVIDRFLQDPAVEVQPGKLPIDETFGAGGDARRSLRFWLFFFNYNSLYGVHEVISIQGQSAAIPGNAAQSMCYGDDVSMTLMFRPRCRQGTAAPQD